MTKIMDILHEYVCTFTIIPLWIFLRSCR